MYPYAPHSSSGCRRAGWLPNLCAISPRRLSLRTLLACAIALIVSACACTWALPALSDEAACDARHYEMLYTVTKVGGAGSGTVIWSGSEPGAEDQGVRTLVLTNHHVVASAIKVAEEWDPQAAEKREVERREPLPISWYDYNDCSRAVGERVKRSTILGYDRQRDLAVLELEDHEHGVEHVAALLPEGSHPRLMDQVWAIGAGLGQPPFATSGEVAHQRAVIQGYPYLLTTAPIIWGNSGGALFVVHDGSHVLVGVPSRVTAVFRNPVTHMAWSIPVVTVREFLRENELGFVLGDEEESEGEGEE
jgi:S1-C subfamily serine protease